MDALGLFFLLLLALTLLGLAYRMQNASPPRCPRCRLPRAMAEEVARYRRHCPQVAVRACPFDPRRGVYRLRR
ncbi:hypothetical protein [Thermus scotoductus]|uniref:Uncharacterized protein n=1 Tax=Thermus scotoductus TaxID=37636 RepID=A0A430RV62_THESC|nr:hypothetical protein [Thermus scotoductus]RTG94653.1 hypothetical protein CSW51_08165 [Thermus scotoductus]RTH23834.1 hypothetical protein CSW38_09950 [Thermus scotoductus]